MTADFRLKSCMCFITPTKSESDSLHKINKIYWHKLPLAKHYKFSTLISVILSEGNSHNQSSLFM